MTISRQAGAIAGAGGQIVGNAAKVPAEPSDRHHERQRVVAQSRDEDQRRPRAPNVIRATIAAGVALAPHGLRMEVLEAGGKFDGWQRLCLHFAGRSSSALVVTR